MKVCVCQPDIVWEDKSANMRICERMICAAAHHHTELVVFPELTLTGFSMDSSLAESNDGVTVTFFKEMSRKYGVSCIFGYARKDCGAVYNDLAVVSGGVVKAEYSKLHPFSYGGESKVFTAGDREVIYQISEDMRLGLTICYDLRFPEIYQELSKTCECIVVSANWPAARRKQWITLLKARAIENQCYIIGCNRCGSGGGLDYSGDSIVVAPDGECVPFTEIYDGCFCTEINVLEVIGARATFPLKQDRRIDLYRKYYE